MMTFLFLNQTLLCDHSLESSRRDYFNEGHIIGFHWEISYHENRFVHSFLTVALYFNYMIVVCVCAAGGRPGCWAGRQAHVPPVAAAVPGVTQGGLPVRDRHQAGPHLREGVMWQAPAGGGPQQHRFRGSTGCSEGYACAE